MQPARIAELLEPFLAGSSAQRLTTDNLNNISMYVDILLRWNARISLTAIRDPEQIVTRHFGESLFASRHIFPQRNSARDSGTAPLEGQVQAQNRNGALAPAATLADVGSGAGFPGIPIKLWAPHIHLTLIESNHKKATFLREVTRALILTDVNIQDTRAEAVTGQAFDVVTLRAVERFESILPAAARLVAPGGRLGLLISSTQLATAKALLTQSAEKDPAWSSPDWKSAEPIPLSRNRILSIIRRQSSNQLG